MHRLAPNDPQAEKFFLSPGQAHDAPKERKLLRQIGKRLAQVPLLMARADESEENRRPAQAMGWNLGVPPKKSPKKPWQYNQELYKKRNEGAAFEVLKGSERVNRPGTVAKSAPKQRDCSGDGRAIIACSPASPNGMGSLRSSLCSQSSETCFVNVNT